MVTLVVGENTQKIKEFKNSIAQKSAIFNNENFDIDAIAKVSSTKSLFEENKTIILENTLSKIKKSEKETLQNIIKNILHSKKTHLVIIETTIDKRSALYKLIKKNGAIKEAAKATENEIRQYIQTQFTKHNITTSPQIINQIAFKTKDDFEFCKNEVQKIITFAKPGNSLDQKQLDQISLKTHEENIFQFLEHIAAKRKTQALDFFLSEIKTNNNAPFLVYMIANQTRNMIILKDEQDRNQRQSLLKIHPYAKQKTQALANKFSMNELKAMHRKTLLLDKNIKTQNNPKQSFVEFLANL